MAEAYHDTALGDEVEFVVHAKLKARDAEGMDWTIEAVIPKGYEIDEDATEGNEISLGSTNEPNMTAAAMMVRKRKADAANGPTPGQSLQTR